MDNIQTATLIHSFKDLDLQIKALSMKRDEIKKELINGYFKESEVFIDAEGKLLATYKESISVVLDQKALKEAHPEIVEQYSKLQSKRTFLAK